MACCANSTGVTAQRTCDLQDSQQGNVAAGAAPSADGAEKANQDAAEGAASSQLSALKEELASITQREACQVPESFTVHRHYVGMLRVAGTPCGNALAPLRTIRYRALPIALRCTLQAGHL